MKRTLLAFLSAALLWASFPPLAWAPAGWVALAPLLLALDGATARQGLRLGFLAGLLLFAGATPWLWRIFGWHAIGLWAFEAVFPAVFGLLVAAAGRRRADWHMVCVPALWVGMEWIPAEGNPLRFGWFVLGLSQSSCPPLLQAADLAGAYGLSFLMVLVSAALLHRPRIPAAVALLAVIGYGARVAPRWNLRGEVPAAVVQSEEDPEALPRMTPAARLVVWPELAFPYDPKQTPRVPGSVLVVGCVGGEMGEKGWLNRALVVGPDGKVLGEYVKHVPIPFFNDGVAGVGFPVFPTPAGRLGVCICYDLDHAWVARGLVRAGAEVLAVPTMDPKHWGALQHVQHTANARVRAVTHRRFLVRACSSGISQVIAPDGRIEAEVPDMKEGSATGKVSPVRTLSPCDRGGWLLAPFCAVWLGVVAVWSLFWRRA